MGEREAKGVVVILAKFLKYSKRVLELPSVLSPIHDSRMRPRIPTQSVVMATLCMYLSRLGSLNALEQTGRNAVWSDIIGRQLPSADTIGRVMSGISSDSIRLAIKQLYSRLKRSKALEVPEHGLVGLAIDGHETSCSYRRSCKDCLQRKASKDSDEIQYYHKNVTAQLLYKNFPLLIDAEPVQPGEGELTAAKRLYARVVKDYPRAFDVVVADALYGTTPFTELVLKSGKDIIAVLKSNAGDVLDQALLLLEQQEEIVWLDGEEERRVSETNEAAFGVKSDIRVIRSCERKISAQDDEMTTWVWLTSLKQVRASTKTVVRLGHARWTIENQGFNETTNRWFADHVYKHDQTAILNFWLLCMIAYDAFLCFYHRNLRILRTERYTMKFVALAIQATLCIIPSSARSP